MTMEFKSPLSQRIVISIVLLTTLVSGFFVTGIVLTIDWVEESLVTNEMAQLMPKAITAHRNHQPQGFDRSLSFFTGGKDLPGYLQTAGPGFTEIVLDSQAFYAYRYDDGPASYYLVKDQSDFERWENRLEFTAFCGFVASVAASIGLGLLMVKRIIEPVRRLTYQVRDREKLINGTPPLASDYANDEVGALANAFDVTIAMLHQTLQRESLFTSDVSHELRTPLMVIKSSCDILMAKNNVDDFTRQRILMIAKATGEMQTLVDAFLALARRRETPLQKASLGDIVREEVESWTELAKAKQIAFIVRDEATGQVLERQYPEVMLRTVLSNLVRNAIHHTTEGEVALQLTAQGFVLSDSGPGIPGKDRGQVFQPFYRGEISHPDSLGLGLSLVQRICEREHWNIALEDNQPRGCRFIVHL